MLKGENVCEESLLEDSKTFYKRRKDEHLLRELCKVEHFLTSKRQERENASENVIGDGDQQTKKKNDLENIRDELEEELLGEW